MALEDSPVHEDEREEYVRLRGTDLGGLFHELKLKEEWLRDKWAVFAELFEKGSERIDLLNRTASNFFYFLGKLLYEDAMLGNIFEGTVQHAEALKAGVQPTQDIAGSGTF
jgi:hypothetical protein